MANRTETAARIKFAFDHGRVQIQDLCVPDYTIHIDSKVLDAAGDTDAPSSADDGDNSGEQKVSKKDAAAILHDTVDTVGQRGKRGEQIRNVISVGSGMIKLDQFIDLNTGYFIT